MTGSMCVSMTGRPTRAQIVNEQRRNSYEYIRVANAIKKGECNELQNRVSRL